MEKFRDKIEEYGVLMERMGMTPVSSRVYIYLLFSKEPGASFQELVDFFNVSKSAVSNALKFLTDTHMVESKTIGGKRKRYFYVHFDSMFSEKNLTSKFKLLSKMLEDINETRNIDDKFGKELQNASLLYKMLLVEFPIIYERWKRMTDLD